jgi:hypothetical protein
MNMPPKKLGSGFWNTVWNTDEEIRGSPYDKVSLERINQTLENALDRTLNDGDKFTLGAEVNAMSLIYRIETKVPTDRPKLQDIRRRLRDVREAADSLKEAVDSLDDMSLYFLLRELIGNSLPINMSHPMALHVRTLKFGGRGKLQENLEGASLVGNAAIDALKAIPKTDCPSSYKLEQSTA